MFILLFNYNFWEIPKRSTGVLGTSSVIVSWADGSMLGHDGRNAQDLRCWGSPEPP